MGPLGMSAKQHREYLKLQSQEQREAVKMEKDESRKQQLHEIKLQEAAVKANQGIGHKEDLHEFKLKELSSPLGKPPKINRQQLGLPSTNPMAGTEMFKQGQHKLQYAQGTDTVPAMLTPGEAVIPAPAAQNPKNKKAIQRMVQEGRTKNKLRDGAVQVVNSDAHYMDGTSGVPSLAYAHSDVPGSSFEDGTERVYDFKRGSSAQANYSEGTYGVVPQQVQQAVGYATGTVEVPNMLARLPIVGTRKKVKGYEDGTDSVDVSTNEDKLKGVQVNTVPEPVNQSVISIVPEQNNNLDLPNQTLVDSQTIPVSTIEVPKPVSIDASNKPVQPPGTTQTTEIPVVAQPTLEQTKSAIVDTIAPQASVSSKEQIETYNPADYTPEGYNNRAQAASAKVRSVADIVEELSGKHKEEKSFSDALTNLFTAKGFKEELGLNNQDIIRMALSTAVGAKRYGVQRALAYAGLEAFKNSDKRQAQQQADQKAIRAAAVTLHGQEMSADKAEKAAEARHQQQVALALESSRKEERRYQEGLTKERRAELRQDANRFEDAMARDFGSNRSAVINKANAIVTGEGPAKDASEYSQRLAQATRFLNSNVYHHHPVDRDPNAWKPRFEDVYLPSGQVTRAASTPTGGWLTSEGEVVPSTAYLSHNAYTQRTGDITKIIEGLLPKIQPTALNKKSGDLTQGDRVDTQRLSQVGLMLSDQFKDLPPRQFAKAFESTVTKVAQEGKQFNSDAIQHAFTTNAIIELNPSDRKLFVTDNKGTMPKGEAMVQFGNVINQIKGTDNKLSDDQAYEAVKKAWSKLDTNQQKKVANLSRTDEGYSPMMEFGIDLLSEPDKRKFKFLDNKK